MIKNIIFDMGGVLIDYDPHKTLRSVFNEQDAAKCEQVLFESGLWNNLDLGTTGFAELGDAACRQLPEPLHAPLRALLMRWWDKEMPPLGFMEDFVREVRAAGYRTYLCSNTSADIYTHMHAIPALSLMDGILASCDYGVTKPDARLYQALYDRFDLRPEECFFIDDMQRNIDGAAATGMIGHCFADKDVRRLREAMRAHGIHI